MWAEMELQTKANMNVEQLLNVLPGQSQMNYWNGEIMIHDNVIRQCASYPFL